MGIELNKYDIVEDDKNPNWIKEQWKKTFGIEEANLKAEIQKNNLGKVKDILDSAIAVLEANGNDLKAAFSQEKLDNGDVPQGAGFTLALQLALKAINDDMSNEIKCDPGKLDGQYGGSGSNTYKAVKAFQEGNEGLVADGWAGKNTIKKLSQMIGVIIDKSKTAQKTVPDKKSQTEQPKAKASAESGGGLGKIDYTQEMRNITLSPEVTVRVGNFFKAKASADIEFPPTPANELDLSGCNLTDKQLKKILWMMPKEAKERLKYLHLGSNNLTTIPAEIGNLNSLEDLGLGYNALTTISAGIRKLTNLKSLYLRSNRLTTLPAEIGNLTSLQFLFFGQNSLTTLPAEIGNLTSLQFLDLSSNNLTTLPAEIGKLYDLKQFTLDLDKINTFTVPYNLYISDQNSKEIDKSKYTIKESMPNMTTTYTKKGSESSVKSNDKTDGKGKIDYTQEMRNITLSPEAATRFTKFFKAKASDDIEFLPIDSNVLDLSGCNLTDKQLEKILWMLPEKTKKGMINLDLSNNSLTTLPKEIRKLTNLSVLNLRQNNLTTIPAEIGKLTNLAMLDLRQNSLTSNSLPTEISQIADPFNLFIDIDLYKINSFTVNSSSVVYDQNGDKIDKNHFTITENKDNNTTSYSYNVQIDTPSSN